MAHHSRERMKIRLGASVVAATINFGTTARTRQESSVETAAGNSTDQAAEMVQQPASVAAHDSDAG